MLLIAHFASCHGITGANLGAVMHLEVGSKAGRGQGVSHQKGK